ncbi:CHY zinc finger domain protein [Penicillium brasilianum]|uniref:CHY zinc finger domain protein n=1 Tax=Penicillium brasilianum TaxID=104259 RepID=A0A1S9RFA2_PENBI|nr:CHY zinc finger domain protein [Penicillium brasilianum]
MENGSNDSPAGLEPQVQRAKNQPPIDGDALAGPARVRGAVSSQEANAPRQSAPKKRAKCRYFASKKGCRAGAECPYIHDAAAIEQRKAISSQSSGPESSTNDAQALDAGMASAVQGMKIAESVSKQAVTTPQVAQTPRPVSKVEKNDPKEFQLNQLRRRFRPQEESDENGSTLSFGLAPSDPDFPFELDALQCVLHVPNTYPGKGRPRLTVTNPEMEAAFQANVSRGFDDIVDYAIRTNARGTLLNWVNALDRQLERLLTTLERGPKLTFVANVGSGAASPVPAQQQRPSSVATVQPRASPTASASTTSSAVSKPHVLAPSYTYEQKTQAEKRRSMETKQLEARLGRLPLFQKRSETTFSIPIQPAKQERLPKSLQNVKTVKLIVPPLYPLEHSSIEMHGVDSPEARSAEAGFAQWFDKNSQMNLVSQINFLASNMHNFAKTPLPEVAEQAQHELIQEEEDTSAQQSEDGVPLEATGDKPHLHVIPRPPEWSAPGQQSGSDMTDESSYEEDSEEDEEAQDSEEGGAPVPAVLDTPGRGVALSFPFLELYGIELLEIAHLAITIKCDRCKESMDIKNVQQLADPKDMPKVESCKKCANSMSIGFRKQLMHSHANRAGYLDLDGCTVMDLLPSNFIPTCSECSTTYHAPGVSAVRGESAMAICRHCHRKMVFKMPEVKFLVVGTAAMSSRAALPLKKRPKEVLGIVAGQELPRRGRCQHYGKSYRWFRFSCCAKVFPCDKCHDAETDHPNEHANRMICGFCSREQIYRPENCGICRAVLIGKAGSGFWEGGKGTRNRALMSRKDPRKYKRRGGTVPGGSSSKKK